MDDQQLNNEGPEIITLTDGSGKETPFEYLDCVPFEGKEYLVLLPADDEQAQVVILEIEPVSDELENYLAVQDQRILDAVYEVFKEDYKDIFTFQD